MAHFAEIYVAAEEYHPSVYAKRNRHMVEQLERVIAVYDGREKGGTVGTIRLVPQKPLPRGLQHKRKLPVFHYWSFLLAARTCQ